MLIKDNITKNEDLVHEKFNCLDCSIELKLQNVHEKLNNLERMQVALHQNIENLLQKLIDEKLAIVKSTKENQSTVPENDSEV